MCESAKKVPADITALAAKLCILRFTLQIDLGVSPAVMPWSSLNFDNALDSASSSETAQSLWEISVKPRVSNCFTVMLRRKGYRILCGLSMVTSSESLHFNLKELVVVPSC